MRISIVLLKALGVPPSSTKLDGAVIGQAKKSASYERGKDYTLTASSQTWICKRYAALLKEKNLLDLLPVD